ncbi:MAG: gliding motility-associated C-terminal domain-containing protein [Flavobacteriales bacterium]|nr:gliding motility-associated C-terminal domain-containing protein [Flavobacteriales bacterium]
MRYALRILIATLALCPTTTHAQSGATWNTAGELFWLGFMQNAYGAQELRLSLQATVATNGTVSIPLSGWSQSFSIPANGSTVVVVPALAENQGSEVIRPLGIKVESNDPIMVAAASYQSFTHDVTQALPQSALGTSYRAQAYRGLPGFNDFYKSELLVVATEDGTEVRITPSVNTAGGRPAGVPFLVSLNAGESYQVQSALASTDLTGTLVEGTDNSGPCRPFAVFSGSMCANVPVGCPACDHIYEQLRPIERWGTNFHTAHLSGTTSHTIRVVAAQNNTSISIDGGFPIPLNAGDDHVVNGVTGPVCITANSPVSVAQVMEGYNCAGGGDPSLLLVEPDGQTTRNVRFTTHASPQISVHRVDLVAPASLIGLLTMDGNPVPAAQFTPYAQCPSYVHASVAVSPGSHVIDAPQGFHAYVHGLGTGESYARVCNRTYSPDASLDSTLCASGPVTLNAPPDFTSVHWEDLDAPGVVLSSGTSYTYTPSGNSSIAAVETLPLSGCERRFVYHIGLEVPGSIQALANGSLSSTVCQFGQVQLGSAPVPDTSVFDVNWGPPGTLSDPTIPDPIAYPMSDTWFRLHVTSPLGCGTVVDSVLVEVDPNLLFGVRSSSSDSAICLGDPLTLVADAEQALVFDQFEGGLSPMWLSVNAGAPSTTCGSVSGNALFFDGGAQRRARTVDLDLTNGGRIYFLLKIADGIAPCEDADPGEDVRLEYSTNGATWTLLEHFDESGYPNFTSVSLDIPIAAQTNTTSFRWRQLAHSGVGEDVWALDNVVITHYDNSAVNFAWSPSASVNQPGQPTSSAAPGSSTWYFVEASSTSGCSTNDSIWIEVQPPFSVTVGADTTICDVSGIPLEAVPSSGNVASYSWSPNNGSLSAPDVPDPVATPQSTTTYTVHVLSDIGCEATDDITVTVGQLMGLSVSAAQTMLCQGNSTTLSAQIQANGPTTLVWSPSNTLSSATSLTPIATPLATTNYLATLTDTQSGCAITDSVEVIVTTGYQLQTTPDTTLCNTLGFQLNVQHNLPAPFTIAWSPANLLNSGSVASPVIMADTTMLFTVTVTDVNGCSITGSVQVTDAFDNLITPVFESACQGESVLLDAGFPGFSYLWSHGPTSQQVSVNSSGTYTVEITDPQGCQTIKTFFVTLAPLPVVDLGPDQAICGATSTTLNANSPGNTVLWSTQAIGPSITVSQSGTYSATATSPAGCVNSDVVQVELLPDPLDVLQDITTCESTLPVLDAGNSGSTYQWNTNETTQTIVASSSGTYSVTVTNIQNCSLTFDAIVVLVPEPQVDLGPDTTVCSNASFQLNAANPGLAHLWNTGATSASITPTNTGIYWAEVTDGPCTVRDSVVVTIEPAPSDLLLDVTACVDQTVVLDAGNVGSAYQWNTGANTMTIVADSSGTYEVLVTSPANCAETFDATVLLVPFPIVDLGPDTVLCEGDVLTLNAGQAGNTYAWSTGATASSIDVMQGGTYSVSVSNGYCVSTDEVQTTFNPAPARIISREQFVCLDEDPHYVVINAGNDGSQFDWSTGAQTQMILAGAYGWYFVNITNQYDCALRDSVVVTEFCPATLYVPNTFTPNNDGINDYWGPVGKNVATMELTVFDRWGGVLFTSNSLDVLWDGRVGGDLVPNDMYVWKMRYRFIEDETGKVGMEHQQMGHVQVLR